MTKIGEKARGRWRDILLALGVERRVVSGKNCPCPFCGGKDRFRFTNYQDDGGWICNRCGAGDGFELVKKLRKIDFREAAKLVESVVGDCKVRPSPAVNEDRRRKALNELWARGKPIAQFGIAGEYFHKRGLLPNTRALRYVPDFDAARGFGAILAKVCDVDGNPVTLQQTILNDRGEKIERKTFWGKHPFGSAVRLAPPLAGRLGIAEGVETALSAAALFGVPTWAALDANHLERLVPPDGLDELVIFGDNDASFTGQAAAYALARACNVYEGMSVEVKMPQCVGQDWNDVLRTQRANKDETCNQIEAGAH